MFTQKEKDEVIRMSILEKRADKVAESFMMRQMDIIDKHKEDIETLKYFYRTLTGVTRAFVGDYLREQGINTREVLKERT
jgi:hypothetical protein